MEKAKLTLAVVGGCVASFFERYYLVMIFVFVAIVMDTITGLIKAKATGEPISSKKGTAGFWKKMSLLMALAFGFFLDQFVPYCLSAVGITIKNVAIIGISVGCYIVLNESISIVENLYAINPSILPKWVKKLLTSTKDKIDKMEMKEEDKITDVQ